MGSSAISICAATSAIANQTQEQVEQGNPILLLVENSVSGVEIKADHEGESSAAPVPSASSNRFQRRGRGQGAGGKTKKVYFYTVLSLSK
ncbi:hypothetical protein [Nostoc sp.]|uniref:hypothetical protein n=1 Tax=Nostoc sp. TaxID=1180 RepID=UPI002FFB5648